ncbi:MAG: FHA domain-containing protein, partial [Planctomycetota bacterium]
MNAFLLMSSAAAATTAHFELSDQSENLLGRDWNCQIVLNDPQCSRIHASIYKNGEGWWIADRKSSNGTFVNNQLIDTAQLIDGCEIRIGTFLFRFSTQQQPPTPSEKQADGQDTSTIIFDRNVASNDLGEQTLDFLNNSKLGQDFYFLFQLSVKLLGQSDSNEVIQICLHR